MRGATVLSTLCALGALAVVDATESDLLSTLAVDVTGKQLTLPDDAQLTSYLAQNVRDHEREAAEACQHFHCGESTAAGLVASDFHAYPMAPTPSVDFPASFADRDVIYVSKAPLFSAAECEEIIRMTEAEGEGLPSTKSGKYQIGKAWIKDMPSVRTWFNEALAAKLFPTLSALFPDLLPDASTLRAHSVAVLKYNASHPQTDLHVDDALFAFTIALSDASSFEGGGTYFEHLGKVVDMPQGHATFRPGAVRHMGSAVSGGVRYVVGGFIAAADKVEHVRRLNERGNKILLDEPDEGALKTAEGLFRYGLLLNSNCSLCHQNLGDTYLRLEQPDQAEESLRRQIELLPRDSDAHFALGNALRGQGGREAEALAAYEAAVEITPNDYESHLGRAASLSALGTAASEPAEREAYSIREAEAYRTALSIKPGDVRLWINIGVAYSGTDDVEKAEAAFREAVAVAPNDPRPPLNLGRYLAKLSRPAEAIEQFYAAAVIDPEYFEEVKLGVGTANAQQGRLREATKHFASASRMNPKNEALKASLADMEERAAELETFQVGLSNQAGELCGTPCQDVVDTSGYAICDVTWAGGCGEETPPPEGFTPESTVAELCSHACAFYQLERKRQQAATANAKQAA